MGLDASVRKLREDAIAAGKDPVPSEFQGVTKARIAEVLRQLDRETNDMVDVVFALLDDVHESWMSGSPSGARFCDGATVAHIACHVGILQRGKGKLDREGRDYWIKPLREIGAVEPVFLDPRTHSFMPGHPVAKSPNSAHRLQAEFRAILRATSSTRSSRLAAWIKDDNRRERLALQSAQAAESLKRVDASHAALIKSCVEQYARHFLRGFEVVYVDDADGDRMTDEDRENLRDAGVDLRLGDPVPDVLLYNRELDELWIIEAVTSDGEVDDDKVRGMLAVAKRHGKVSVGFTTAYSTWRHAGQRQAAHKNIPPATYVWIREDPSKHYRAESFGADGSAPSTISSKSP